VKIVSEMGTTRATDTFTLRILMVCAIAEIQRSLNLKDFAQTIAIIKKQRLKRINWRLIISSTSPAFLNGFLKYISAIIHPMDRFYCKKSLHFS
jgi:hypothetical protein